MMRSLIALAGVVIGIAGPVAADDKLDPAVLARIKDATVHFEVNLANGSTAEGSGFFTEEPGVIITNAHVLGMLDAEARRPASISVTVRSGETDSRTLTGDLLAVDRASDLAVLRVDGKNLPTPLAVVKAGAVTETEEVFVVGFPFGKNLGKNITVSKSSVSSLRKVDGVLKEIQVNGGMHPGNSGGPVCDAKGQVVGVAISGIRGTTLNFAIPGDTVQGFLKGKITGVTAKIPFKNGDKLTAAASVAVVDPLKRIKPIQLDVWTGDPIESRVRPASGTTEPAAVAGDSAKVTVPADRVKTTVASADLTLPPKPDGTKVYWLRPVWVNGAGEKQFGEAISPNWGEPIERREATVTYRPDPGLRAVELNRKDEYSLESPFGRFSAKISSKTSMVEKFAAAADGSFPLNLAYKSFTHGTNMAGATQSNDPKTRSQESHASQVSVDMQMTADGTMGTVKAANMGKVPQKERGNMRDFHQGALKSLRVMTVPLPQGTLKPMQTWTAQREINLGASPWNVPAQMDVTYTYLGTRTQDGRAVAQVELSGSVRGAPDAERGVAGTVAGDAQVALDNGEVLSAQAVLKVDMDAFVDGGRIRSFGTTTVQLGRRPRPAETEKKK